MFFRKPLSITFPFSGPKGGRYTVHMFQFLDATLHCFQNNSKNHLILQSFVSQRTAAASDVEQLRALLK